MRAWGSASPPAWTAVVLALILSGCASLPATAPGPRRPPVEAPSTPPPPERRATVALLDEARLLKRGGKLDRAASVLERALRIAPDDAEAWHHLAAVRLEQEDFRAAEQLAKKSNRLAPRTASLQAKNWTVIARARRGLGDEEGALIAEARAREVAGDGR